MLYTPDSSSVHPYRLAEEVSRGHLYSWYQNSPATPTKLSWRVLERALTERSQKYMDMAGGRLDAVIETRGRTHGDKAGELKGFKNTAAAAAWYQANMLKAALPAFQDRMEGKPVSGESANSMYWDLVHTVMPGTASMGFKAEALIAALGARAALLDDPSLMLYPSSPREGTSSVKVNGRSVNHDFYYVVGGYKMPIEVKNKHANKLDYADPVAVVSTLSVLGPAILGVSAMSDAGNGTQISETLFKQTHEAMMQELVDVTRISELDLASAALWNNVLTQHAAVEPDPLQFSLQAASAAAGY